MNGYDGTPPLTQAHITIQPMRVYHIPAVSAIEKASFPTPWPASGYRAEIKDNKLAHYVVARMVSPGSAAQASLPNRDGPPAVVTKPTRGRFLGFLRLGRTLDPELERLQEEENRSIVGYAGLWIMVDEAHITTIAVAPPHRGQGFGELLLLALIEKAHELAARLLTLEVRLSNHVAQNLYRKYTFKELGIRRRYYSDNGEDAVIMSTEPLASTYFQQTAARNRAALEQKLGWRIPSPVGSPRWTGVEGG